LVANVVSLEYNAPFKLSSRVVGFKFGTLFDADTEETPDVDSFIVLPCFRGDAFPFPHGLAVFQPCTPRPEAVPLRLASLKGGRVARNFFAVHRSGDTCVERRSYRGDLVAVAGVARLSRKNRHRRSVAGKDGFVSGRIEVVCPLVVAIVL
jgi:hypothetical protein